MISEHLVAFTSLLLAVALAGPTRFDPTTSIDGPNEVTFNLYSQGNPTVAEIIRLDDDFTSPSFNPANPTRVVIHGGCSTENTILPFRDAYIATGEEINIILVDWARPACPGKEFAYNLAVLVGDFIGEVLNHLIDTRGLNPDTLTIIGHSMGGHVAGITGNRIGGIASEVVALDPASDDLSDKPLEDQLDSSDAQFVQVIHTNAGEMGVPDNRGDVDFYPDGGINQHGCSTNGNGNNCDHAIVLEYYAESIISRNFVATQCSSYNDFLNGDCKANQHTIMGEWAPHTVSGSFYLETNDNNPYGKGDTDL